MSEDIFCFCLVDMGFGCKILVGFWGVGDVVLVEGVVRWLEEIGMGDLVVGDVVLFGILLEEEMFFFEWVFFLVKVL